MKNKQHRMLMAEMDKSLRKVTIVSGMAQRLTNKVAIVTGAQLGCWSRVLLPCMRSRLDAHSRLANL